MLIKQKRINSEKYFANAIENTPVFIKVDNVLRFSNKLKAFGFNENLENGNCILPSQFNKAAEKMQKYIALSIELYRKKNTHKQYTGLVENGPAEMKLAK